MTDETKQGLKLVAFGWACLFGLMWSLGSFQIAIGVTAYLFGILGVGFGIGIAIGGAE